MPFIVRLCYSKRKLLMAIMILLSCIVTATLLILFIRKRYRHEQLATAKIKSTRTKMAPMPPRLSATVKKVSGIRNRNIETGLNNVPLADTKSQFNYMMLPDVLFYNNLSPSVYQVKDEHMSVKYIIGVLAVKRNESNVVRTLKYLIDGLTDDDVNITTIIIGVAELDKEFLQETTYNIKKKFPKQMESGLIKLMAASRYIPTAADDLPLHFGNGRLDSYKRIKEQIKKNTALINLMVYAFNRSKYYLTMEDDVIANDKYMEAIKQFTNEMDASTPNWIILEFCRIGAVGKLFKTSELINFVNYLKLFYFNIKIDNKIINEFIANRACPIDKSSDTCAKLKTQFYPTYKSSLFQRVGPIQKKILTPLAKVYNDMIGKKMGNNNRMATPNPDFDKPSNKGAKAPHHNMRQGSGRMLEYLKN